ncbi:MAG TPA: hypothetical protein VMD27_10630 [Candidatus Aquilonibacter sp.]|nr:hypothetical protein [Candidatus Aquilonibacter sp.]
MSLLPIERQILNAAKFLLHNSKLKEADLLEWSNSKERVQKNLRENEIMLEFPADGLYAAFPKAADKRQPSNGQS